MNNLNERFECELPEGLRARFNQPPPKFRAKPDPPLKKGVLIPLTASITFLGLGFFGLLGLGLLGLFFFEVRQLSPPPMKSLSYAPEVRRAEPVVLRAEPVVGASYPLRMPDGKFVSVTFRGYLKNANQLPLRGAKEGDMYGIGNAYWILTTPVNGGRLSWIDP
jgi:hypothetical protein